MATYWENSCSFGLRYVSWYKYLIVSLVFSHLGFWSGNLFLSAPFPDLCLLVPFHYINTLKQKLDGTRAYQETDTDEMSVVNAHLNDLPVLSFLFVSMKAKTNFLRCIGYLSFTKDRTKLDLLLILVLVLPLNFLNY